jgi:hypothetical protein
LSVPAPIGIVAPLISVTRPAKYSMYAALMSTSKRIAVNGLPVSTASSHASSSACSRRIADARRIALARSCAGVSRHAGNAARAAAIARATSSAEASTAAPSDSPVPGAITSRTPPPADACHAPP